MDGIFFLCVFTNILIRFTHASPTLFNAGTPHPQLSSCFLIAIKGDHIDGIYDTLKVRPLKKREF